MSELADDDGWLGRRISVSITDGCVSWETTLEMLDKINKAVVKRREVVASA